MHRLTLQKTSLRILEWKTIIAPIIEPFTHYIIVREDLPLGFQAAQICHAANRSIATTLSNFDAVVVLGVQNQHDLLNVAQTLQFAGVKHTLIQESDPPHAYQYTAIGVFPVRDRSLIKKCLSTLPLFGKNHKAVPFEGLQEGQKPEAATIFSSLAGKKE